MTVKVFGEGSIPGREEGGIRIVSYNVLAQCHAKVSDYGYCPPGYLKLNYRFELLLSKICNLKASVVCLQEVDNYSNFWQPRLQKLGYDGIYNPSNDHPSTGVAIFYLRETFQLFRSERIDFNTVDEFLQIGKRSARYWQHNRGMIIGLQPWEESTHPSAICVSTVSLVDTLGDPILGHLQRLQHLMLLRKLEAFNASFHLPVIVCGTFNCLPYTNTYKLLTTGAFPRDIKTASSLQNRPTGIPVGRSQVQLSWDKLPECGDTPITGFIVKRRGNFRVLKSI